MPLDFPNSPTLNQIWNGTNGAQYQWDGAKWILGLQNAMWLPLSGGTLTGPLTLSGNATSSLQPVTLQQQNAALGAYLPLAGGQMSGPITPITTGNGHAVSENFPSLDFRGGNISFYRNITNATGNEVGANPKVFIQLDNACANYTVQPWGGYDGPTAFFVNATNHAGAAGSVVATWSQITSQGNNNYTAQDTAHYVRVIRTGQNSCWGIAIQHQDNTGMPAQPFSTMAIENAMQINGPDDPRSYYNATYSFRQGMSFIPSVNPTNTWTANTQFSKGIIVTGTPSSGVLTCYVAQNTGTTGATQPSWPTSGNVSDGSVTWATGTIAACELGCGILMGGGRPQLPNQAINIGIGFNSPINGACIDTSLAVMNQPQAAAIRLAEGHIIDFTGGGALANQNRRTFGYSDALSAMALTMNAGMVASTWADDGSFTASHVIQLAGNSNLAGVTKGDVNHLTIGKNLGGFGEIDMIVGSADFINFYGVDSSGNISVPSPFITLGQQNSTFQRNLTVNGNFTAQGTNLLANLSNLSSVTTGYSDTALTIGRNNAGFGEVDLVVGSPQFFNVYGTNGSGVLTGPLATIGQNSTFAGNVTVGHAQPNYVTIAGGAAGSPATITTAGPWGDLDISPALNGQFHSGIWRQWPAPDGKPDACRWDYLLGGVVASGQSAEAETHSVNTDNADASNAMGGGMGWFNYSGNISAGAVGGRTGFGMNMVQSGATTCPSGQFYVAGAFWVQANHSAGGTAGNTMGSLFASNDLVKLQTGAGLYWEEIIGYELDVSVQAGTGCSYKHGMKIITGSDDVVSGHAGHDYAYSLGAQAGAVGWDVGYAFGDSYSTWPMKATGTLIGTIPGSGGPAYAAAWGVDFSQVAFSGGLIRGPSYSVDGSGHVAAAGFQANSAGINFNNQMGSGPQDLSKHINLYQGQFGICMVSGATCYNVAGGSSHNFYSGTTFIGDIDSTGLNYMPIGATGSAAGSFTQVAVGGPTGPTWTTGAGAPSGTQPAGSLYSRTAGATGTRLYVSAGGGVWNAVAGV